MATAKSDSIDSPRPVLDVWSKEINLQPKPVLPKFTGQKHGERPTFVPEDFFAEKNFFIIESLCRLRFWSQPQVNYYSSVLFDKNKVFPHRHIPHVDMESIQCFEPVMQNLHDAGILSFYSDICDWNEEIIFQFYATLHISGDPTDYSSWALDG